MKPLSPAARISLGLVLLTTSILLCGDLVGLIPNPARAVLESRKTLCESLAVQFSLAARRSDRRTIQRTMGSVVERNKDVLSAAMRTAEGTILAEAGDHGAHWVGTADGKSTPTHAQVPIFSGKKRWGTVEVAFQPIVGAGIRGFLTRPLTRMLFFTGIACFVAYFFFIKKTLRHLDPTSVIPARVKNTLDILSEGVLLLDQKERIVLANSAFAKNVGRDAASLMGEKASELKWVKPRSDKPVDSVPWLKAIESGEGLKAVPLSLTDEEATKRTFMVNGSPILDGKGKVRGALATFDDVTDIENKNNELNRLLLLVKSSADQVTQKNRQLKETNQTIEKKVRERTEELRKSKEAAESANVAKSAFLANISHELRTPMHAVLSFSEFGMKKIERASKEKLLKYFKSINESGSNLLVLLNDLLDLSKFHAGRMTYDFAEGDLRSLVMSVLSEFATLFEKKSLRFTIEPTEVRTDAVFDAYRVKQVLRNLLSNAVKFTDEGKRISIAFGQDNLKIQDEVVPGLTVSVLDEGIGIPESDLESIFEPFSQSKLTDSGAGGTGLGLPISKEIVVSHGGWIRAANRPGGGAIFTFALPCTPIHVEEKTEA